MKVRMTTYGLARTGKTVSEDAFAGQVWDGLVVAALADGVGSAQGAREAADRIVHSLIHHYAARPRSWSPERALDEFAQSINRSLREESLLRYGSPEMVATVAATVLENGRLYCLNVGDSRIYLVRGGEIRQLSRDHVIDGVPHALSRAIGLAPIVDPEILSLDLQDSDILLLCSDGVSNHLNEAALKGSLTRRDTARTIVRQARERVVAETDDDLSAIVIDISSIESPSAPGGGAREIAEDLAKGDEIDGYQLQRAFQNDDRVWLAQKEGKRFILKFAPREAKASEEHLRQFQREVFNATRVTGRYFPASYVPSESRWNYYVMGFVDAPTLHAVLKQRMLTVEEALMLGRFLCQACQELTGLGLLHGDLKPENVLAFKDGDALEFKLLDLGSAMEIFTIHARAGTASYLAPERFGDAPASERTEIFAIGVTLYRALTQRFPYGEIERFQTPRFRTPKRPMLLNPNIPPWLDAVLTRTLSPAAEPRYASFSELLYDFDHPESVEPFRSGTRDLNRALAFYRGGFFTLLAAMAIYIAYRVLTRT
jgi:serine/threonine protein phosphatase PrpC